MFLYVCFFHLILWFCCFVGSSISGFDDDLIFVIPSPCSIFSWFLGQNTNFLDVVLVILAFHYQKTAGLQVNHFGFSLVLVLNHHHPPPPPPPTTTTNDRPNKWMSKPFRLIKKRYVSLAFAHRRSNGFLSRGNSCRPPPWASWPTCEHGSWASRRFLFFSSEKKQEKKQGLK